MDAAKSGCRVRVGELFVECAGKTRFSGFGFFWQSSNCALRGRRRLPDGENSQDQSMVARCILAGSRDLKWKSQLDPVEFSYCH
jgi:hypothetical protein